VLAQKLINRLSGDVRIISVTVTVSSQLTNVTDRQTHGYQCRRMPTLMRFQRIAVSVHCKNKATAAVPDLISTGFSTSKTLEASTESQATKIRRNHTSEKPPGLMPFAVTISQSRNGSLRPVATDGDEISMTCIKHPLPFSYHRLHKSLHVNYYQLCNNEDS
jgi:hypothetical protein